MIVCLIVHTKEFIRKPMHISNNQANGIGYHDYEIVFSFIFILGTVDH